MIPENAVFVLETTEAEKSWQSLKAHPLWQSLKELPALKNLTYQLSFLDSITGSSGELSRLFRDHTLTISYHPVGAENFELLYILQTSDYHLTNLLEKINNQLPTTSKLTQRTYADTELTEVSTQDQESAFTFTRLGNLLVLSESSFLVEEAIRLYVAPLPEKFWIEKEPSPKENHIGTVYLSAKGLTSLLKGTARERENPTILALESMGAKGAYSLYLSEEEVRLDGVFSYPEKTSFTPSYQANWAVIQKGISNRALALTQYNLSGIQETINLANKTFQENPTTQLQLREGLTDRGFLDGLSGECYLQEFENMTGTSSNLILVCRILHDNSPLDILRTYMADQESPYTETYKSTELFFIPDAEVPAHLFGGKFQGFPSTFIFRKGDLLFFANSTTAAKQLLDDLESKNYWGSQSKGANQSPPVNPSAGFAQLYKTGMIWSHWVDQSNNSWSAFLQKYKPILTKFPYLSLEIRQVENQLRSSLTLPLGDQDQILPKELSSPVKISLQQQMEVNHPLSYGPKGILNHQDGSTDILIQDQNHVLYLINEARSIVFQRKLSGPIVSDAYQIDYYKNDKLQLVVATEDKIYGLDRLGNPLPNYPLPLPEKLSDMHLVDYENSRDYRYFLTGKSGDLYLLDKTGKNLEGWNPNPISEAVLGHPSHYRVPGKGDYMSALTVSGKLHLFNRRGENKSGSPYTLSGTFRSELHFGSLPSSERIGLTGLTEDGELLELNFQGEIINRTQLEKNDRDSKFYLIPNQNGQSYLLLSKSFNQLKVYQNSENELFSVRTTEGELEFQYFDFGRDRQILVLVDPEQRFAFLYDLEGNLLTDLPLDSQAPIHVSFDQNSNQYRIHTIIGNQLRSYLLSV